MAETTDKPPYPAEGVTSLGLHEGIMDLADWVNAQRVSHNKLVGSDAVPPAKFGRHQQYSIVPVMAMFGHLLVLRRIREAWDRLIRNYEKDWGNPRCLRQRVNLLQAAAVFVNSAMTPLEYREASGQKEMAGDQRLFDKVQRVLDGLMETKTRDPNPHRPR